MALTRTQQDILEQLKNSHKPMKIAELSSALNLTWQTISNNAKPLIEVGSIVFAYKDGNASYYTLGNIEEMLPRVFWNGTSITITEKVREIVTDNKPIQNPYMRVIVQALADLYRLSVQAVNDKPPTFDQIKRIQSRLFQTKKNLDIITRIISDLVENPDLWDARQLPKELLINDPEMTSELAMSIVQSLYELTEQNEGK